MASDAPVEDWEALVTVSEQHRPAPNSPSPEPHPSASERGISDRLSPSAEAVSDIQHRERIESSARSGSNDAPKGIDEAVYDALLNHKTRLTVLRFEADVQTFIGNEEETELRFPLNLTGYQRLLCHRVAQYHGLQTSTIDTGGEHHGKILVVKPQEPLPVKEKLADVKIPESSNEEQQLEAPKLLKKRSSAADRYSRPGGPIAEAAKTVTGEYRSVQDREQEYHLARERIFNSQSQWPGSGPQGGGGQGRGMPNPRGMAGRQGLGPQMQSTGSLRNDYLGSPQAAAAGGRGKAVFRNRQEELKDPDFQRDQSRYGPRFVPRPEDDHRHPQAMYSQRSYYDEFPGLPGPPPQRPNYPQQQRSGVNNVAQMMGTLSLHQQGQEGHPHPAFVHSGMHPGLHPSMHMPGYPGMPMQMAFVPGPGGVPQGMQGMHQMQGMQMYHGGPQMTYPNFGPMQLPYGYMPARPGQEGMMPMLPGALPHGMVPVYPGYPGQGYPMSIMPGQPGMPMQQMHASPPSRGGSMPPSSPAHNAQRRASFTRQMRNNSSSSINSTGNSQQQQGGLAPSASSESVGAGGNPPPPKEPRPTRK